MSMDDLSPGEIFRSLKRLEDSQEAQTETLGEIKEQTTKTNGRVDRLEDDVRDLKNRRFHHRSDDNGEDLSMTISPRMWKFFVAGAATISPLIVEWVRRLVSTP
jgi:uncharacterized coiled-coil protein SlyX